jgi:hypothetical protein
VGVTGLGCTAGHLFGLGEEGLRLTRLVLCSPQLILLLSFCERKSLHQALDALDVCHVQVNFLLQDYQIFVHFYFQVVAACFDFGLKLKHLLLLVV